MPCLKCSNNKYKYGKKGKCIYDTLKECQEAAAAIHAQENQTSLFRLEEVLKYLNFNKSCDCD